MRLLIAAAVFLISAPATASTFSLYPGLNNPDAIVEMTTDHGLTVEIVLRCERKSDGSIKPGIMTYSKVEKLFCSSKMFCTRDAEAAADDTCGY